MRVRPAEVLHGESIEELVSLGDDDMHALSTVGPHVIRDNFAASATAAGRQPMRCVNVNMRERLAEVPYGDSIEELVLLGDDDRHVSSTVGPPLSERRCCRSSSGLLALQHS